MSDDRRPLRARRAARPRRHVDRPARFRPAAATRGRGQAARRASRRRRRRSSSAFAARRSRPRGSCTPTSSPSSTSGSTSASGRHYIVMEYVRGQSGAEILRDRGYVTRPGGAVDRLARLPRASTTPTATASSTATSSPATCCVPTTASSSSPTSASPRRSTPARRSPRVGSVLGTAAYLSPEQARGEDAGPASDVYALGVVAYQLLSGRLPYEATSLTELAAMQEREAPPLLDELVDGVRRSSPRPSTARSSLEPHERFATADEMRAALAGGARCRQDASTARRGVARARPATTRRAIVARPTRGDREPAAAGAAARAPPRHAPPAPQPADHRAPAAPAAARRPGRAAGAARRRRRWSPAAPRSRWRHRTSTARGVQLRDVERQRRRRHDRSAALAGRRQHPLAEPARRR